MMRIIEMNQAHGQQSVGLVFGSRNYRWQLMLTANELLFQIQVNDKYHETKDEGQS